MNSYFESLYLSFENRNSSGNFPFAAGGWSVVLIFEYPTNMAAKKILRHL